MLFFKTTLSSNFNNDANHNTIKKLKKHIRNYKEIKMEKLHSNKKYFVKFVHFNQNTMSSLINKTVKFSTVYEFNDFNELNLRYSLYKVDYDEYKSRIHTEKIDYQSLICDFYTSKNNISFLTKYISMFEKYNKEFLDKFSLWLDSHSFNINAEIPEEYLNILLENIDYSSTGIFCMSNISVFTDDSAHLMFAHYADNLKGVALIYELLNEDKAHKIIYSSSSLVDKQGRNTRLLNLSGTHENLCNINKNLIFKSNKWSYEDEYRIFNEPGLYDISSNNSPIKLSGILYTEILNSKNIKTLEEINNNTYSNKLVLSKIKSSTNYYRFNFNELKVIDKYFNHNNICDPIDSNILHNKDLLIGLYDIMNAFFRKKTTNRTDYIEKVELLRAYYSKCRSKLKAIRKICNDTSIPNTYDADDFLHDFPSANVMATELIALGVVLINDHAYVNSKIKTPLIKKWPYGDSQKLVDEKKDTIYKQKCSPTYQDGWNFLEFHYELAQIDDLKVMAVHFDRDLLTLKARQDFHGKLIQNTRDVIDQLLRNPDNKNCCIMVVLPNLGKFEEKYIKNSIDAYINTYFSLGSFKSNKEFKIIYFVSQEGF